MASSFQPDYACHPGESLREILEDYDMTVDQFSSASGLSADRVHAVLRQQSPLTEDIARQLEAQFRVPARFWLNLQSNYDETMARLDKEKAEARR